MNPKGPSSFVFNDYTKKKIPLLAMNPKRHSSFVFSDYTKKQIPLHAMNPKGRYSFVSSDSTKKQTSSLNQVDRLLKTFITKSRSLEKLFVRMEERKKIE